MGWKWHHLHLMRIICTLLQTDSHASISVVKFFTGWMLVLTPSQQRQSIDSSLYTLCNVETDV